MCDTTEQGIKLIRCFLTMLACFLAAVHWSTISSTIALPTACFSQDTPSPEPNRSIPCTGRLLLCVTHEKVKLSDFM